MSVYKVDEVWLQKLLSLPFAISAVVTLSCHLLIGPFLGKCLFSRDRREKLGTVFLKLLNYKTAAAVHAVGCILYAGAVLASGEMLKNKMFGTTARAASVLHFTMGYTATDTLIVLLNTNLRRTMRCQILLHHFIMIFGGCFALYHQMYIYILNYMLFVRQSHVPFGFLQTVTHEAGGHESHWYYAAYVARRIVFSISALVATPWLAYQFLNVSLDSTTVDVPLYAKIFLPFFCTGTFVFLDWYRFYHYVLMEDCRLLFATIKRLTHIHQGHPETGSC